VLALIPSSWLRTARERAGQVPDRVRSWASRVSRRELGILLGALGVLGVAFGPALFEHVRLAANPAVINDDARQQIYPFFRYEDRELFPRDYIGKYYLACLPIGYRALYTIGAFVWGAEPLSKLLPYVLLLITVVATSLAARRLAGAGGAFVAAALMLGSGLYLARMSGGLPRSFGFPIMALTVLALVEGRPRLHAACVLLGAAFYPASAVPAGLSLALSLFLVPARDRGGASEWPWKRRVAFLANTALLAAAILAPTVVASRKYGSIIQSGDVAAYPESGPGGRYMAEDRAPFPGFFKTLPGVLEDTVVGAGEPFSPPIREWLEKGGSKDERYSTLLETLLVLVLVGGGILFVRKPGCRRLMCLPLAALAGYSVARSVAPNFYLPQRYVLFPAPITATVMLAVAGAGYVSTRASERRPFLPALAALLLGLVSLYLLGGRGSSSAGLTVKLKGEGGPYRFARSLPKSALLAGFPDGFANNAPYVSRRAVLVSSETHQAFHAGYADQMRERLTAIVRALYAEDAGPLNDLRERFGVTHFYFQRAHLLKPPSYFRPFDRIIQSIVAESKGKPRFVESPAASQARVYDDGSVIVLDLGKL
jgi:hypothetical protein